MPDDSPAPASPDTATTVDVTALLRAVEGAEKLGARVQAEEEQAAARGADWHAFWRWCEQAGHSTDALPISVEALADWLDWALGNLPADRISSTLAAIKARHVEAGFGAHIGELGA